VLATDTRSVEFQRARTLVIEYSVTITTSMNRAVRRGRRCQVPRNVCGKRLVFYCAIFSSVCFHLRLRFQETLTSVLDVMFSQNIETSTNPP
jgi:hypothetical protein